MSGELGLESQKGKKTDGGGKKNGQMLSQAGKGTKARRGGGNAEERGEGGLAIKEVPGNRKAALVVWKSHPRFFRPLGGVRFNTK